MKPSNPSKAPLLFIALGCLLVAAGCGRSAAPEPPTVDCRGVIVDFVRNGFQGAKPDGTSELLDVTWVVVEEPGEFAGVRTKVLSRTPDGKSPLGKAGDTVSFTADRATLQAEKSRSKTAEKKPSQPAEPNR